MGALVAGLPGVSPGAAVQRAEQPQAAHGCLHPPGLGAGSAPPARCWRRARLRSGAVRAVPAVPLHPRAERGRVAVGPGQDGEAALPFQKKP